MDFKNFPFHYNKNIWFNRIYSTFPLSCFYLVFKFTTCVDDVDRITLKTYLPPSPCLAVPQTKIPEENDKHHRLAKALRQNFVAASRNLIMKTLKCWAPPKKEKEDKRRVTDFVFVFSIIIYLFACSKLFVSVFFGCRF